MINTPLNLLIPRSKESNVKSSSSISLFILLWISNSIHSLYAHIILSSYQKSINGAWKHRSRQWLYGLHNVQHRQQSKSQPTPKCKLFFESFQFHPYCWGLIPIHRTQKKCLTVDSRFFLLSLHPPFFLCYLSYILLYVQACDNMCVIDVQICMRNVFIYDE